MAEIFIELFSFQFIQRALLVGVMVALCAALLGVSLVLKHYSMIGDGLSHVGFGALSVAVVMNVAPLMVSIPVVIVAAVLLLRISDKGNIKGDAAIALISSSSIAVGVIVTSLTTGMNADVSNFLFGSILALSQNDLYLSVGLSLIVLLLFIFSYNKIFAVTFDEDFAKATGTHSEFYNTLIALLTAVTIVIGMRIMGALLISSLLIFPALSSMRIFNSFKSVIISSAFISVICFFLGTTASYVFDTPTGASIVAVNMVVFGIFSIAGLAAKRI